jgi:hypothetical protein
LSIAYQLSLAGVRNCARELRVIKNIRGGSVTPGANHNRHQAAAARLNA